MTDLFRTIIDLGSAVAEVTLKAAAAPELLVKDVLEIANGDKTSPAHREILSHAEAPAKAIATVGLTTSPKQEHREKG